MTGRAGGASSFGELCDWWVAWRTDLGGSESLMGRYLPNVRHCGRPRPVVAVRILDGKVDASSPSSYYQSAGHAIDGIILRLDLR